MQFKDYYKIMELTESATAAEIKKAYRKLARRYHPDVSKEENAEQKFKDLGEAYEVLKDPEKKREYDQLRQMGGASQDGRFTPPPGWESATHFSGGEGQGGDFSDFFEAIFGRNGSFHRSRSRSGEQHFSARGEDVHADLSLLLEEAFKGGEQLMQFTVPQVDEYGLITHAQKKLKVKIPAGMGAGQTLRIKGQGAPGIGGGPAGDLLLRILLAPHPLYTVDGKNISLVVPISPWEAALGARVEVPTLHGRTRLTIPAASQGGARLRLAGKGLPGSVPGDFYVILKIVMPEQQTEKSRELFAQLATELPFNPRSSWEEKK
ncbi:MAG: DnaJ C-terminal domain-containing protein [Pseudomonadales bacterium]|nr:DnaJ C-terminal domain-containing protein [Pseudomonadales bacterium]